MKPFKYLIIGIILGTIATSTLGLLIFSNYRDYETSKNRGYIMAQYDIHFMLSEYFGTHGQFPNSDTKPYDLPPDALEVFTVKASTVHKIEKDGIPTLYVIP